MAQTEGANYWNKAIETMPRDQLRELQLDRLKKMVQYVYVSSPFHRRNFEAAGVHPDDIRSLDDIEKLPFTDKEAYNESQQESSLRRHALCSKGKTRSILDDDRHNDAPPCVRDDLAGLLQLSGNRGQGFGGSRCSTRMAGGRFFSPWPLDRACGESLTLAWMKLGAQIIPVGGYSTEYRAAKIVELGVDCIVGTATYMNHLCEVVRSKGI